MAGSLHSLFLSLLVVLFEDDELKALKTGMPVGHRNVIHNQRLMQLGMWFSLTFPFIGAGLIFWAMQNIPWFINSVLTLWAVVFFFFVAWKVERWRMGDSGSDDIIIRGVGR